jgi:hypothetical protein
MWRECPLCVRATPRYFYVSQLEQYTLKVGESFPSRAVPYDIYSKINQENQDQEEDDDDDDDD